MTDQRISKLAYLLVNYSVGVQPGDTVLIMGSIGGRPLVRECYRETIRAGGHPLTLFIDDEFQRILLNEGSEAQLRYVPEPMKLAMETFDCRIAIRAPENTRHLSNVDSDRQRINREAYREIMAITMKRSAAGDFRWVGTNFPTAALAQDADMSLEEYEDFVYGACHVDLDDPVAAWLELSAVQERLVDWLSGKKKLRIQGPNVDLFMGITDRSFINSDGKRNMPSGEIFTGPVEESVNGWVKFTYPAIYSGREVSGVELHFKDGRVVKSKAEKNESFLNSVLDTDSGARYLGEFAVGTNQKIQRFTRSILYDEKIGGTIHMALGAGYPETGSINQSSVHWDMICDMRTGGKIWVDDELFYDSGRFIILD